jgi:elongation factor Ts
MAISASDVKNLREMTGAGMMACKDALKETNGNIEEAVEYLRKKGLAQAEKKAGRIAAEGTIVTQTEGTTGVILEVNCETDFVSKGDDFQGFAKTIAAHILKNKPANVNALLEQTLDGASDTVAATTTGLTAKCGEKVDIRRFTLATLDSEGILGSYNHGGKIGVIVELATGLGSKAEDLAKDLSMHVAAAAPKFLNAGDIDEDFKNKEAEIYKAQLRDQGKPEEMLDKIVMGKLNKLASEVCLMEQKFVKDPDLAVKKLVENVAKDLGGDIAVKAFHKVNLGEGIEKKEDNLAEEVAKMTGKQ